MDQTLRVQAGGQHLNQGRGAATYGIRQTKNVTGGSRDEFGKAAVGVAPEEHSFWAQMGLADLAVKALAAEKLRVNDDPVSGPERIVAAAFDDPADHFVAHDPRVFHGDRAIEDFEIGSADSGVSHANQNLARPAMRPGDVIEHQFARRFEDHCFHRRFFITSNSSSDYLKPAGAAPRD